MVNWNFLALQKKDWGKGGREGEHLAGCKRDWEQLDGDPKRMFRGSDSEKTAKVDRGELLGEIFKMYLRLSADKQ